jgi:predicted AAA+ superfamily ATPase
MKRKQESRILQDLQKKMVLIAGPRQAGKTYLAKTVAKHYQHPTYLNYDSEESRKIIQNHSWLDNTDLLILDELHKMPDWKQYLKGLYDTKPKALHILVTGSARLEIFKQVGDSLAGRYFLHHLLPLSLAELKQTEQQLDFHRLIERSGFPEPYLAENNLEAERWRMQYRNSLLNTDVLDFENIKNLKALQTIFELLRSRVSSPASIQSIAEDIAISPTTVNKYIHVLEALYIVFRITPFSKNIARSLLKEPKIYFFDTGLVKGDHGAKLENQVAVSLLKNVYARQDYQAEDCKLHYLKDKEKREVDFAIIKNDTIETLIEVKTSDKQISPHLKYFADKYQLNAIQLVQNLLQEQQVHGIQLRRAENYLAELFL